MADEAQPVFEYEAGRNDGRPIPLRAYQEEELGGIKKLLKGSEEVLHE
jgi:hypothetical protein